METLNFVQFSAGTSGICAMVLCSIERSSPFARQSKLSLEEMPPDENKTALQKLWGHSLRPFAFVAPGPGVAVRQFVFNLNRN